MSPPPDSLAGRPDCGSQNGKDLQKKKSQFYVIVKPTAEVFSLTKKKRKRAPGFLNISVRREKQQRNLSRTENLNISLLREVLRPITLTLSRADSVFPAPTPGWRYLDHHEENCHALPVPLL